MSSFLPSVGTVASELEMSSARRQERVSADSGDKQSRPSAGSFAQPDFRKAFTAQISSLEASRRQPESNQGADDSARSQRGAESKVENNDRHERLSKSQRQDYSEHASQAERRLAAARDDRQSLERQNEQKNQDQKYSDRQTREAQRSDKSDVSSDKDSQNTALSGDRADSSASVDSRRNVNPSAAERDAQTSPIGQTAKHASAKETEVAANNATGELTADTTLHTSQINETDLAVNATLSVLDKQNIGLSTAAQDASLLPSDGKVASDSNLLGLSNADQSASPVLATHANLQTAGGAAVEINATSLSSGVSGLDSLKSTTVPTASFSGPATGTVTSTTSGAALLSDAILADKQGGALNKLAGSAEVNSEKLLPNTGLLQGQAALNNAKGLQGLTRLSGENFTAGLAKNIDAHLSTAASISDDTSAKTQGLSAFSQTGLSGTHHLNAAARVQMPVSISFGQSGWSEMVAERSAMMAAQSIKFAELQLDPPELGQLQVKVSVNQDQASVSFVAPNAQVKEALDQTMARLKELFEQQGLNLGDVDVSDQSSSQSQDDEQVAKNSHGAGDAEPSDEPVTDDTVRVINSTYGIDHYA